MEYRRVDSPKKLDRARRAAAPPHNCSLYTKKHTTMANPSIESRLRALEAKVFIESLSPLTRSERRLIGDVTTPRGGAVPRVSADGEYVYDSDTDSFAAVGPFVEQSCHECRTVMCHVSTELGVKTPVLDECCCECHDRFWREHRRRARKNKRWHWRKKLVTH